MNKLPQKSIRKEWFHYELCTKTLSDLSNYASQRNLCVKIKLLHAMKCAIDSVESRG